MTKTATTNMPPAATVAGAEADLRMLGIYLNDHRAGATAGLEIARRSLGSNRGNAYGDFLERLAVEIEEDLHTLEDLIDTLGIGRDRLKSTAAWLGEKAGRLKLNGRLLSYSPMSRVVEIEVLCLGVEGKAGMWAALAEIADLDSRMEREELERLHARAQRQRTELEEYRLTAAREAFERRD